MIPALVKTILLVVALAAPASAQTLRIAMAAETDGADPHHFAMTPNSTLRDHVFEELVFSDPKSIVIPGLATSWERLDDLTWRFNLRTTARFSNGARFGAPDVVATFCRILNNRDELGASFSPTVRRMTAVVAEGEDSVIIRTAQPEPLLLTDLRGLAIIPRAATPPARMFDRPTSCGGGEGWPGIADFNALKIPGTGPFRIASYTRSGTIVLNRNPHYDGPRPHWAEVRLTPLTQQAARLASLLAGDQDVIEAPGTPDIPRLRTDPRFTVTSAPTLRLLFLQLDVARDPTPFVTGRNLLRDPRVRQALSLAIGRTALVDRIMDGNALPATQYLPGNLPSDRSGTIPGAPILPYDPARARALLKEAGAEGMSLTLHATNNRYVNDGAIAQAIVQQWQRVGVKAAVDTMPAVTFFSRRSRRELSVYMGGWATPAPETLGFFRSWLTTTDEARGVGSSNYGGWSDPEFDAPVAAAMATMDDVARSRLLQKASARALDQMPAIPLYFENAVWATRAGLSYPGRTGEITIAQEITEVPITEVPITELPK